MNNTASYISELLYRYECVILPGFGAFLTRRQPAIIKEDNHSFFPPKKLISFNSQLRNNDGLLANYISSAENISYTDAVAKIQRFVLSVNEEMNAGQRIELEKIGSFFTSVENTLQFEPLEEVNYLTESFGLSTFVSPNIQREELPNREVYKQNVEAIEESTPITFTPERRKERPYLQYAAIAAVVLGISGFFGLKQMNKNTIVHNTQVWKEANAEIENQIQEATFEISNPLPAVTLSFNNEDGANESSDVILGKYHIIAGAFRVLSNANKKVEKLKAQGFDSHLIGPNKYGLHQVVYHSYTDRVKALKALRSIKKDQSSSAWLLVQEL